MPATLSWLLVATAASSATATPAAVTATVAASAAAAPVTATVPAATPAPDGIVQPPATLWVGGDAACDFNALQPALNAATSGDSIRLARNLSYLDQAVQVTGKALTVSGGYDDCSDAAPSGYTVLGGNAAASVVTVRNPFGPAGALVVLRQLVIRGGGSDANGGGGIDIEGDLQVRLDDVRVYANSASVGGGIRIAGPQSRLRLLGGSGIGSSNAALANEAATSGGGIHCADGAQIELQHARVHGNVAVDGGGMYLDGCQVATMPLVFAGSVPILVSDNHADGRGGGIHASNGTVLSLSASANQHVHISGNTSGGDGGGVYLSGMATRFLGSGVRVDANAAGVLGGVASGGGVFVGSAEFDMDRGNPTGADCNQRQRCSSLSANSATYGAAAYASFGHVDVRQTFIEDNVGVVFGLIRVGNGTLDLEDNQIRGNQVTGGGDRSLVLLVAGSEARLDRITLAGNLGMEHLLQVSNSNLSIRRSILWQPGTQVLLESMPGNTITAECLNAHEDQSMDAVTHDPGFVGASGATLYRLRADSPNVDACAALPAPGSAHDLVGDLRVHDAVSVPNQAGPVDRGALELPLLFADGLED